MPTKFLVIHQNGRNNFQGGERDINEVFTVNEDNQIQTEIIKHLSTLSNGGHILVNYKDKFYICEKNNLKPNAPYVRFKVNYHPLMNKLT